MPSTSVKGDPREFRRLAEEVIIDRLAAIRLTPLTPAQRRILEDLSRAAEEIRSLRQDIAREHRRRGTRFDTLDQIVAWEREFGAEVAAETERRDGHPVSPSFRREKYKYWAREFGLPYAAVRDAIERARAEAVPASS